ncbi:unnamed protein product, partial [marine sediment metagenome]
TLNSPYSNAGNYVLGTFPIDFGRYLYDPELALDPKKFRNLQLKITHDEVAFMATTGINYCEVLASVFDEKVITPVGFLMSKEHYAYTPTANDAFQYIDLPTDYPIRQMLIRGFLSGKDPTTVVDEARLSEDNDKRVVFDLNLLRYRKRMQGVWTPIVEFWEEYLRTSGSGTDHYFTPTSEMTTPTALPRKSDEPCKTDDTMRGGLMTIHHNEGGFAGGMVIGFLPNHCIQIPFGMAGEIDSWYDVTRKGSVKL